MESCSLCCCLAVLSALALCRGATNKFYIGGLFPDDSKDPQVRDALGVYTRLAAQLAVQHVNEGGVLAAYNLSLEMLSFGTSCRKDSAVYAYLQMTEALQERSASGITAWMEMA